MNIGIFYASAGGSTTSIAESLAKEFDVDDENLIFMEDDYDDIDQFEPFDVLFIGSSTWGQGDPHFSWVDAILEIENDGDFDGKKVAFFGAGDCDKHSEHFCSALGKLYKTFTKAGAKPIGFVSKDDYSYEFSLAEIDGKFCGLAIDNHNEKDKTPKRVDAWIEILKSELGV
ncbi:MAG: flavodoxin domain-containing protein [Sulfurovaceae bacterium]|nr:flavodoxin domain-containing protein [Sulfurovaceae bacterium]MDD5548737.1 flavodoxin domain-containing protein [Sulfurovaceae bacterium]